MSPEQAPIFGKIIDLEARSYAPRSINERPVAVGHWLVDKVNGGKKLQPARMVGYQAGSTFATLLYGGFSK